MKPLKRMNRAEGFSLLEAMIVVAIVAVLAAASLPAYSEHLARSQRAQAWVQLQMAAHYMHRFYAANDSYANDRAGTPVATLMPLRLTQSPPEGEALYRMEFAAGASSASDTDFKLVMMPVAGARMAGDRCGALTLDSLHRRGNTAQAAYRAGCLK